MSKTFNNNLNIKIDNNKFNLNELYNIFSNLKDKEFFTTIDKDRCGGSVNLAKVKIKVLKKYNNKLSEYSKLSALSVKFFDNEFFFDIIFYDDDVELEDVGYFSQGNNYNCDFNNYILVATNNNTIKANCYHRYVKSINISNTAFGQARFNYLYIRFSQSWKIMNKD